MGVLVAFETVKDGIFPVPEDPKLMAGLLFVQLKVVPPTSPVNEIASLNVPLHFT